MKYIYKATTSQVETLFLRGKYNEKHCRSRNSYKFRKVKSLVEDGIYQTNQFTEVPTLLLHRLSV